MKHKRIFLDATVYTLSGYIVLPLSVISSLYVKQSIGPYLAGVMGTLNLLLFYASFCHFGVLLTAERDLPYCLGSGDTRRFESISRTTFSVTIISGVLFACGMAGWAVWSRSRLNEALFVGTLVYCLYVVVWLWSAYYMTLLRTRKEFVFLSKIQIFIAVFVSVGNIVSVMLYGFWGLLAVAVLGIMAQSILLTHQAGYIPSVQIDWSELRKLVAAGVPLVIFGLAMTGIKTIDSILILRFLGIEQLGIYSIALVGCGAVFQLTNSIGGVLYPSMQESYGENTTIKNLSRYVMRPSRIMGVLLPAMIAGLFLMLPPVVEWLLPQFSSGIPAFQVISIGAFFLAMIPMSVNFLIAINKQLNTAVLMALSIGLIAVLGWISSLFEWGVVGIAVAASLGYFSCFVIINAYALRHWMGWMEIFIFLRDLTLPIIYVGGLLALSNLYPFTIATGVVPMFGLAAIKFIIICLAYVPLVLLVEPKTGLISDFVRPTLGRLLRLNSSS